MHSRTAVATHPEQRALLCCARVHLDPETRGELSRLLRSGLDFAVLAREARRHGLTPLLCRHLHDLALDECPAELLAQLKAATQHSVVASLAQASEMVAVLDALRAVGVSALAIKGPVSATLCYGDFGLRTFSVSPAWQARLVRLGTEHLFRHADGRRLVDLHWCLHEKARLFWLIAARSAESAAAAYRDVPVASDEFSSDDEPLAWDAEGWENVG